MVDVLFSVLFILSILGSGLMAGVFFAFSVFVMRALRRLPAAQGIAAMQAINVAVINPLFMVVFLGTALPCLGLAFAVLPTWHLPASICLLAGAALYVGGSIGVTMLFNVPLNKALASAAPENAASAEIWHRYLWRWSIWNHVRTLACIASTASFLLAEHPIWNAFTSNPVDRFLYGPDPLGPHYGESQNLLIWGRRK